MGTFAVENVVSEIESRLGNIEGRLGRGLDDADDASDQFVELVATVELVNRYAGSELLSGGRAAAPASRRSAKGSAAGKVLSEDVIARLKKWVVRIRKIVLELALSLHATGWAVTVGFPWNLNLTLEFTIPKP